MTVKIPSGFERFAHDDGYIGHNGPYYVKTLEDGSFQYGFQSDERHGNPNNVLHGASLFGFVDTVLGHMVVHRLNRYCATISLNTDFMAPTPTGSWVDATAHIKKTTKSLAFVAAEITLNEKIVLSANGVFKLFPQQESGPPPTAQV